MGEIANWFFHVFRDSKVTKGTARPDRAKIEDVFRAFITQQVRFWKYVPYIGFKPRPLTEHEMENMLRGEEVKLIGVGMLPAFNEADCVKIPRSLDDDLNSYWEDVWLNRFLIKGNRFYMLNDESAKPITDKKNAPTFQFKDD